MKKVLFLLLAVLMIILPGCGTKQAASTQDSAAPQTVVYHSDTSPEDCYLCGGGIESLVPAYWGQDNIALISLNTFEIKPITINRYDDFGQPIEEYAGYVSFTGGSSKDGGFSAILFPEYDRGFATGNVDFFSDEVLDVDKAASFLCSDCLNKIIPQQLSQCFGVGAIHLATKEICLFRETLGGFGMEDFYIDCDLNEQKNGDSRQMSLLAFYCPIRYEAH